MTSCVPVEGSQVREHSLLQNPKLPREKKHAPAAGGTLLRVPIPGVWEVVVYGRRFHGWKNGTKKYEYTSAGATASTQNDGSDKGVPVTRESILMLCTDMESCPREVPLVTA